MTDQQLKLYNSLQVKAIRKYVSFKLQTAECILDENQLAMEWIQKHSEGFRKVFSYIFAL